MQRQVRSKAVNRNYFWTVVYFMAQTYYKLRFSHKAISRHKYQNKQTNSVVLVRTRTIPTERPPPVGEVSANFCG